MCACVCAHATPPPQTHLWWSESLHHYYVGPVAPIQVIRFGHKHPSPTEPSCWLNNIFFLSSSWTQNKCLGTRNEVGNQSLVCKMGPAPEHRTRRGPEVWCGYFKATWENVGRTTPRRPKAWERPSFKGGKLWSLILKTQESRMSVSYMNGWGGAQWCMRTWYTVCTLNSEFVRLKM